MSRAFVKEDNAGEAPIIPSRPSLPPGTPNYVTPQGLAALRAELEDLESERTKAELNRDDEANRTRQLTILKAQIAALTERLASAKLVDSASQPTTEVRFGATVTLITRQGKNMGFKRTFTIVGVDEANIGQKKIAFVAPIAKAVLGAKKGQLLELSLGPEKETVEVVEISYG